MRFDRRLTGPLLITLILVGAHWSYGVLRGYEAIALAVLSAVATEFLLRRLLTGQPPQIASAYISGISIAILVRSPALWPYPLGAVISIMSKHVLCVKGRHLWNPSNFGICVLLFLAPFAVAPLSVQWGNNLWPMLVIWLVGLNAIRVAKRAHITVTYVASFVLFALVRSLLSGGSFLTEVAPITGPMYQLFALFMVTDPKTTVSSPRGAMVVVFLVAFVEMFFRLAGVIYAPFYALFLVGPSAVLAETWWKARGGVGRRKAEPAGAVGPPQGPAAEPSR
jgi:Na+-translocating ferredoxin:NAD+ oxidoreductase RnfD subunit